MNDNTGIDTYNIIVTASMFKNGKPVADGKWEIVETLPRDIDIIKGYTIYTQIKTSPSLSNYSLTESHSDISVDNYQPMCACNIL